jgi:biotin synthase-related radical SAM superfamily protein
MKIGDLVKNKYNNKVGVIIAQIPTNIRIVGVMYSVYVDGLEVHLHETDLEVL